MVVRHFTLAVCGTTVLRKFVTRCPFWDIQNVGAGALQAQACHIPDAAAPGDS